MVVGQQLELLWKEGFQGLCDPSMKPLALPGRRSLVDGSPHLLVAEAIAGVRLDQESQAKQIISRRRVEIGIDRAGCKVRRSTSASQKVKINLGANSGGGSQDLLGSR